MGVKVSSPRFMAFSVSPMEKTQTMTPTITASCCFQGVAPTRKPVFRSCEVSPALAEAMQTSPPMLMASAPKAGSVQPFTRKIAAVAISVAMVMPETGLAELPIKPTMREDTVTNRNPKKKTSSAAAEVFCSVLERAVDGRHGAEQGDESGGGYGARAHGTDIRAPQIAGRHLRNGRGSGINRAREARAEEVNGRHEHEPTEDASGEQRARDLCADDVAHAHVL